MSADLNHIIVHATDPRGSARFLADVLGTPVLPDWGPFVRVEADNGVTLDYVRDDPPFTTQHCAFLVDDATFDRGHRLLVERRVATWADPFQQQPDAVNHFYGGRGVYFEDPDGHLMELITAPYAEQPAREPGGDRGEVAADDGVVQPGAGR